MSQVFFVTLVILGSALGTAPAHAFARKPSTPCNFELPRQTTEGWVSQYLTTSDLPPGTPARPPAMALYLTDESGSVLRSVFEINQNDPRPVASTQKMLTAWVTVHSRQLDDRTTYTTEDDWFDAANDGNPAIRRDKSRIPPGDEVSVRELLQTMLEQSSNSAASALAHDETGSHHLFVEKMNVAARQLIGPGGFDSYFQNPSGLTDLDERLQWGALPIIQHSTAHNMARMMARILASPEGQVLETLGVGNVTGEGIFEKYGYTRAAGRTVVVRWRLPEGCRQSGTALVLAAFGNQRGALPKLLLEIEKTVGLADLRHPSAEPSLNSDQP